MKLVDLFTNAGKEDEADVNSPAFSLTKVQAGIGALIVAVSAVVPTALKENQTVVVAAIAAGTVVMLGVFALAAVDMMVRQRAAAAKLQYGSGAATATAGDDPKADEGVIPLVVEPATLVVQKGPGEQEYKVEFAKLDGDKVTLIAMREGKAMDPAPTFHRP
jgi:hypothetical protein